MVKLQRDLKDDSENLETLADKVTEFYTKLHNDVLAASKEATKIRSDIPLLVKYSTQCYTATTQGWILHFLGNSKHIYIYIYHIRDMQQPPRGRGQGTFQNQYQNPNRGSGRGRGRGPPRKGEGYYDHQYYADETY